MTHGRSIGLKNITKNDVLGELGLEHLQAVRIKCALLSLKVLKSALYSYLAKHIEEIIFGVLIVFFLIVEPHGLARLWQIGKEKLWAQCKENFSKL